MVHFICGIIQGCSTLTQSGYNLPEGFIQGIHGGGNLTCFASGSDILFQFFRCFQFQLLKSDYCFLHHLQRFYTKAYGKVAKDGNHRINTNTNQAKSISAGIRFRKNLILAVTDNNRPVSFRYCPVHGNALYAVSIHILKTSCDFGRIAADGIYHGKQHFILNGCRHE